jgi:hypothetical protein
LISMKWSDVVVIMFVIGWQCKFFYTVGAYFFFS